jgi:two-component system OmpR family response regulator
MAHVLIVEDEVHLGVGIKYNLEAEGYRVSLCHDGPSALKLVEHDEANIDLIILDLMLPGMSGYAVCETIRERGWETPILMLTARTLSEDRIRGFDAGTNQYMSKPFDLDELLARVRNLLRQGRATNGEKGSIRREPVSQLTIGRIRVNFQSHEVYTGDEMIPMTTRELTLLRYFIENPDRVISRAELLRHVWNQSAEMQTRTVDQFVLRLRKIIEEDPGKPRHLLTIRDAGYRFILEPA